MLDPGAINSDAGYATRGCSVRRWAVLNVRGFPLMLNWYVVHRKEKRLPPVAEAFNRFLLSDGAALIKQVVGFHSAPARRTRKR